MVTKQDNQHVYCVILAGGSGTRFWPRSRQKKPKQLCQIGDAEKTMLELTVERIQDWIPKDRIIVVTHTLQAAGTEQILKGKVAHILAEPTAKNTAPALTLAAAWIDQHFRRRPKHANSKEPVLISLHADHVIKDRVGFIKTLETAVQAAEQGQLTLIGIKPTRPETGFGYIEQGPSLAHLEGVYKVASFVEKPAEEKARRLVAGEKHFWNTGLFTWQTSTFVEALRDFAPELYKFYQNLSEIDLASSSGSRETLATLYPDLESISVDHAILEKARDIALVPASFDWHDVGSWAALSECFATDSIGNYLRGNVLALDTKNSTIDNSTGQMVATIGLTDIILVVEKDAILLCHKKDAQKVKDIVARLKEDHRDSLT